MTTSTMPKTMHWGQGIRVISTEVAAFFYNSPGWKALEDVQEWAKENNGRVESAHGILEQRVREQLSSPSWTNWLTANYEEDIGLDAEGRFGEKGEAVMLAIQGGGIMLSSPERLQEAYTYRTPKGEPSLSQEEIRQVLAGMLPNGQQILLYTHAQLSKESVEKLPQTYAIVTPLKDLEGIKSGTVGVDKLPKNKLFVIRAGHVQTAENYAKTLRDAGTGVREYENRHSLSSVIADSPSGRVLRVGSGYFIGLDAGIYLSGNARFVGVSRAEGAAGAAPQKQASPLEELAGKARDAGNGTLIINAGDISQNAYNALTGAK